MLRPAPVRLHVRHPLGFVLLLGALSPAVRSAESELTSAAAVRALSVDAAAEGRAVRLRGQLMLVTATGNAMVLLDRGEGIYVALNRPVDRTYRPGDLIEVTGVSDAGDFAPIVRAAQTARLGSAPLPPPRDANVAEINAGGLDAAWVGLRGIVRACTPAPGGRTAAPAPARESWWLTFAQGDDQMSVQINGRVNPADLVDAEVRLSAVVFNVHNAHRQFVRANVQVPDPALVERIVAPPADPFARPVQRVGDVLRFSRDGFSGHRVHVRGIVTGQRSGRTLWIRDGDRGLRIETAQADELHPGDLVQVAGFADHGSYTPSLSDAVFRSAGAGTPPEPHLLLNPQEISRHDANLVAIDATLREVRRTVEGATLVLDWEGREVHARTLWPASPAEAGSWRPGGLFRVAGLCVAGQGDVARATGLWQAEDLQLWVRTPSDLAVLRPAPWLTPPRVVAVFFAFALLALAVLLRVAFVARRQLAQREEARKLAEVEFSAMLAERNRLARDIHDTLAQDLNAVSMQLELAKNAARSGQAESASSHLGAAHGIVRKCLTEARESIWNMRSHILEQHTLPEALRRVAAQLAAGTPDRVRPRVEGEVRRLSPQIENNLLRIGQEAVANALRHSGARTIELALHYEPTRVLLRVCDDGTGIAPAALTDTGSHFGLSGMRERAAQMNATFRLEPGPAGGTCLEVAVAAPG